MEQATIQLLTFAGGVISSSAGFIIVNFYHAFKKKNSLAAALAAEIESIRTRYLEATQGQGIKVAYDGTGYISMNLEEDYFTVFNSNADKIGEFSPPEATAIVTFYITAKGFVDSLRGWQFRLRSRNGKPVSPEEQPAFLGHLQDLAHDEAIVFAKMEQTREILQRYAERTLWSTLRGVFSCVKSRGKH